MQARTYENLLRELEAINAPPDAKRQFAEILRRNALQDGVKALERQERIDFARHLWRQGVERSIICIRLMERFQVGESTAYRDISKAMETPPNSGVFWDAEKV